MRANAVDRTLAYLGPEGTYTHEAARMFAARLGIEEPIYLECASFDEVFDCVDRGRSTYGVVGKENSLEGPVTATLDNFAFRSSAVILAEQVVDIHHCLVAAPGTRIEDVTCVASHAQGIAQCRRFLAERLPNRPTMTTFSTAESARRAVADATVAGIANAFAAEVHGAKVLASDIEDHLGNQTVFALIGRPGAKGPDGEGEDFKTSLALFMQEDRAGTLNMILSELLYAGINMTMIQSRPTKQQLGDYMFFIEFKGSVNDLEVQTALNCLRLKLREVKVLGSYPAAQVASLAPKVKRKPRKAADKPEGTPKAKGSKGASEEPAPKAKARGRKAAADKPAAKPKARKATAAEPEVEAAAAAPEAKPAEGKRRRGRPAGSKDTKPRKTRSDKGKKRGPYKKRES